VIVAGDVDAPLFGAEKFTVNDVVPAAVTLEIVGAAGTVVPAKLDVATPLPAAVTARNCNAAYAVFGVNPVNTTGLVVPVAVDHVLPPSVENSYFVIVPAPVGAVNATDKRVESPVTADATGDVGAAANVAPDTAPLATPEPPAFTARIFTLYDVFDANATPVDDNTVIDNGDDVPDVFRARHVVPPSVEYS